MIQLVVFYAMCHTFLFRIGMVVYVYIYCVLYSKGQGSSLGGLDGNFRRILTWMWFV